MQSMMHGVFYKTYSCQKKMICKPECETNGWVCASVPLHIITFVRLACPFYCLVCHLPLVPAFLIQLGCYHFHHLHCCYFSVKLFINTQPSNLNRLRCFTLNLIFDSVIFFLDFLFQKKNKNFCRFYNNFFHITSRVSMFTFNIHIIIFFLLFRYVIALNYIFFLSFFPLVAACLLSFSLLLFNLLLLLRQFLLVFFFLYLVRLKEEKKSFSVEMKVNLCKW